MCVYVRDSLVPGVISPCFTNNDLGLVNLIRPLGTMSNSAAF